MLGEQSARKAQLFGTPEISNFRGDLKNPSKRSLWRDLNPQPPVYKTDALPLSYKGNFWFILSLALWSEPSYKGTEKAVMDNLKGFLFEKSLYFIFAILISQKARG